MGIAGSYLRGMLPRPATAPPPTVVRRPDVRVDPAHLLRYARVCGATVTGPLPPVYPHLLGFAPALALMADRSFPFRLPGLVHTAQAITWYRPIAPDEVLDVEVSAGGLAAHPRGATVDVRTRVYAGDDEVWFGRATYLHRGRSTVDTPAAGTAIASASHADATAPQPGALTAKPGAVAAEPAASTVEPGDPALDAERGVPGAEPAGHTVERGAPGGPDPVRAAYGGEDAVGGAPVAASVWWRLPAGLGRRYAAVSGDRNPIHLSAVTARAFGFRTAIAHGMWSAARCLAALGGRLPERGEATVSFRRPVRLPGRVGFGCRDAGDAIAFWLTDPAGTPLVAGRVRALP